MVIVSFTAKRGTTRLKERYKERLWKSTVSFPFSLTCLQQKSSTACPGRTDGSCSLFCGRLSLGWKALPFKDKGNYVISVLCADFWHVLMSTERLEAHSNRECRGDESRTQSYSANTSEILVVAVCKHYDMSPHRLWKRWNYTSSQLKNCPRAVQMTANDYFPIKQQTMCTSYVPI